MAILLKAKTKQTGAYTMSLANQANLANLAISVREKVLILGSRVATDGIFETRWPDGARAGGPRRVALETCEDGVRGRTAKSIIGEHFGEFPVSMRDDRGATLIR